MTPTKRVAPVQELPAAAALSAGPRSQAGIGALPVIARAQTRTLRVALSVRGSGPLALFGEGDGFVLDQVRKQWAGGVESGGKRYNIEFIAKDTRATRCAQRPWPRS